MTFKNQCLISLKVVPLVTKSITRNVFSALFLHSYVVSGSYDVAWLISHSSSIEKCIFFIQSVRLSPVETAFRHKGVPV